MKFTDIKMKLPKIKLPEMEPLKRKLADTKLANLKFMNKKTWEIVKKVLVWLVVAVAVFMMIFTVIAVNTFDRNDRSIFGYKAYIVMSDSMSATDFDAGDLIFVKNVKDPSTLVPGDIISYTSQNSANYGQTVTHKIRAKTVDSSGQPGFITYGTTTGVDDEAIVTYPYILGKYQGHLPNVGNFFHFLKTIPGYLLFILVPFLLLLIYQGINCVKLFRQYKEEQADELKAEREKLEEERAESQKMMEELMALRAQLGLLNGQNPEPGAVEQTSDVPEKVGSPKKVDLPETVAMAEASDVLEDDDLEFIDLDEL